MVETMRVMSAVILTAACVSALCRADDDRIEDDPAAAVVRQEGNAIDLEQNFDANVFGQHNGIVIQGAGMRRRGRALSPTGPVDDGEESVAIAKLRRLGAERIARVHRLCKLSDGQRMRLEFAVESDARQLAQEIEATRSRYAGVVVNFGQPEGQKKWQQFQQDMQRCRGVMQSAFDSNSLFEAVLAESLDDAQRSILVAETGARRSFLWQSMVETVLSKLDETLGLTQAQHGAIRAALLAKEPRLKLDSSAGRQNTHAQCMLVYHQLSKADSKALRGQLSDRQWKVVSMLINQGKAMKSWLDQQGLVEPGK